MKKLLVLTLFANGFFLFSNAQEATRTITGLVTTAEGAVPLEGVNVAVKGTSKISGSQTDGIYYITVGQKDSVLVFSHAEYQPAEIRIGVKGEYNISLKKKKPELDDSTEVPVFLPVSNVSEAPRTFQSINSVKFTVAGIRLKGMVLTRSSNTPLSDIHVYTVPGEEEGITNANGEFIFTSWQKFPLVLKVAHPDYETGEITLNSANDAVVVKLSVNK